MSSLQTFATRLIHSLPLVDRVYARTRQRRKEQNFREEFRQFKEATRSNRFPPLNWEERYPCLDEKTPTTPYNSHYVLHTAWAARVLAQTAPSKHVDISSLLYFSTLVSAFVPTRFYDYRPANLFLSGLTTGAADLLSLPFPDGSVESLSCMHVIEHVGLGRYGDPMDPEGDMQAINELRRVVAPGGQLLFVVPTGRPRILFNAHRIYSQGQIVECFPGFALEEFSLVEDQGPDGEKPTSYIENAPTELADRQEYGCGMFLFRKHSD